MYEITITVDTNDADYATAVCDITKKQLDKIKPLIAAIKKFKPYKTESKKYRHLGTATYTHNHNYPHGECCREDLGEKSPREYYDFPEEIFELFEEFLPWNEYGFHTIISVGYCPSQEKTRLL